MTQASDRHRSEPFYQMGSSGTKEIRMPEPAFPQNFTTKGWLDIRTRPVKDWKRRYFVLSNNFLLSAATPYATQLERVIPLEGIRVTATKTSELSFEINARRKRYYFRAGTPGDCTQWTELIERAATLKIKDVYRFLHTLGMSESQNTKVVAARHRTTGTESAIKIVDKRSCDQRMLANEVQILKRLDNPHIVQLHDLFETRHYLYLVMEKCEGGELFERIAELEGGHYNEQQSCMIVHQIAQGVKYMHTMGIVHRDLKPENILCVSRRDFEHVKIADFGISKIISSANSTTSALMVNSMETQCGTITYTAPEILRGQRYNSSVDFWSIGVIMHILLVGYPPFYADTDRDLQHNILRDELELDPDDWAHVSEQGKALVVGLLEKHPARRKGVEDILKHAWIESSRGIVQQRSFHRARQRFSATVAKRRNDRKLSMGMYEQSSSKMAQIYHPRREEPPRDGTHSGRSSGVKTVPQSNGSHPESGSRRSDEYHGQNQLDPAMNAHHAHSHGHPHGGASQPGATGHASGARGSLTELQHDRQHERHLNDSSKGSFDAGSISSLPSSGSFHLVDSIPEEREQQYADRQ